MIQQDFSIRLSVIIVNYKAPALLEDCLNSIFKFDTEQLEIIVVDNQSDDGCEKMLADKFPTVKFIQMGYNAGFARANNAAIRIATGEAILLLNSDTIVLDNALNKSADHFLSTPHVACGVQLLNADHSFQFSGSSVVAGGLNYLLPLPYVNNLIKVVSKIFNINKPSIEKPSSADKVDWINGAFLMVKRYAIEKAGMMDEDFFLYAEEAEWCSRIRKIGELFLYGDYHVVHLQGVSAGEAFGTSEKGYFNLLDKKGLQILVSNFLRFKKEFGIFWFLFHVLAFYFEIFWMFLGVMLESLLFFRKKTWTWGQWWKYLMNMIKLWPYLLKIMRGKPYFYKVL